MILMNPGSVNALFYDRDKTMLGAGKDFTDSALGGLCDEPKQRRWPRTKVVGNGLTIVVCMGITTCSRPERCLIISRVGGC